VLVPLEDPKKIHPLFYLRSDKWTEQDNIPVHHRNTTFLPLSSHC